MEKERLHPLMYDLLDQNRQGKISRREFLRFSALLGVSAGASMTLGGFAHPGRAWAATPKRGGTLKISSLLQKVTHPAQLSWPEPSNQLRQVAQLLTRTDYQNVTHPILLKKWEVSGDLKTWTLHLKQGIKFNNGDDFTSEDVAFTIGQWLDPENKSAMLGLMGAYLDRNGIEKVDPYTVKLHLKKGEIGVPEHLYSYQCIMLNRKTFEGDFTEGASRHWPLHYRVLSSRRDLHPQSAERLLGDGSRRQAPALFRQTGVHRSG